MFAGNENYIDVHDVNESLDNPDIIELDTGGYVTMCLPPSRASSRKRQREVARTFAATTTGLFVLSILMGGCFLAWMKLDFDRVEQRLVQAQGAIKLHRSMSHEPNSPTRAQEPAQCQAPSREMTEAMAAEGTGLQ